MKTPEKTIITVAATIDALVEQVWNFWTDPKHIIHWNNASDKWHTPEAENDLRVGGRFLSRMEAKDGTLGFDFSGRYDTIEKYKRIEYTLDDDRKVQVTFVSNGNLTIITEAFEAEQTNTIELQRTGWQAILDNFKKYAETSRKFEALHFEINIKANAKKVYQTMLDEKKWSEWTSAFNSASHFKGSWKKGSKILFMGTDQDGKMAGMASKIIENIPNKFVSIQHQVEIRDGKEMISGPGVNDWAGALENYTFSGDNRNTLLSVDIDTRHEFKSYFIDTWPKALDKLKVICEK